MNGNITKSIDWNWLETNYTHAYIKRKKIVDDRIIHKLRTIGVEITVTIENDAMNWMIHAFLYHMNHYNQQNVENVRKEILLFIEKHTDEYQYGVNTVVSSDIFLNALHKRKEINIIVLQYIIETDRITQLQRYCHYNSLYHDKKPLVIFCYNHYHHRYGYCSVNFAKSLYYPRYDTGTMYSKLNHFDQDFTHNHEEIKYSVYHHDDVPWFTNVPHHDENCMRRIDFDIGLYYMVMGRNDYFDTMHRGKFYKLIVDHYKCIISKASLEYEIQHSGRCLFDDLNDFPLHPTWSIQDIAQKYKAIYYVIEHCYRMHRPPSILYIKDKLDGNEHNDRNTCFSHPLLNCEQLWRLQSLILKHSAFANNPTKAEYSIEDIDRMDLQRNNEDHLYLYDCSKNNKANMELIYLVFGYCVKKGDCAILSRHSRKNQEKHDVIKQNQLYCIQHITHAHSETLSAEEEKRAKQCFKQLDKMHVQFQHHGDMYGNISNQNMGHNSFLMESLEPTERPYMNQKTGDGNAILCGDIWIEEDDDTFEWSEFEYSDDGGKLNEENVEDACSMENAADLAAYDDIRSTRDRPYNQMYDIDNNELKNGSNKWIIGVDNISENQNAQHISYNYSMAKRTHHDTNDIVNENIDMNDMNNIESDLISSDDFQNSICGFGTDAKRILYDKNVRSGSMSIVGTEKERPIYNKMHDINDSIKFNNTNSEYILNKNTAIHFDDIDLKRLDSRNNTDTMDVVYKESSTVKEIRKIRSSRYNQISGLEGLQRVYHKMPDVSNAFLLQNENIDPGNKIYHLGFKIEYTKKCTEKRGNIIYVQPKYSTLKQESIQHTPIEQFENEYNKAKLLFQSSYCQNLINRSLHRNKCQIMLHHVLSVLFYCNYDCLQCEFSKTYRENIANHSNFYHMGKLLKEVVNMMGETVCVMLYHGVNRELHFELYAHDIQFNGPLSTSTSFRVAILFADNKGLVIALEEGQLSSSRGMAVSWFSDYPSEQEVLFVQNPGRIKISNIIEILSGVEVEVEYGLIIDVLKYVDQIIRCAQWNLEKTPEFFVLASRIIEHKLSSCFMEEFKPYAMESLTSYAKHMIDTYFNRQRYVNIDYKMIISKYAKFKWLFLDIVDDTKNINIKLDLIHALCPNIYLITVENIKLCSATLEYIHQYLSNINPHTSKLQRITIAGVKDDSCLGITTAIAKFKERFNDIEFDIKSDNQRTHCLYIQRKHCKLLDITTCHSNIYADLHSDPIYYDLAKYFEDDAGVYKFISGVYRWNKNIHHVKLSVNKAVKVFTELEDNKFNALDQESYKQVLNSILSDSSEQKQRIISEETCIDVSHCYHVGRLQQYMKKYKASTNQLMDDMGIVHMDLDLILNDFLHCIQVHDTDDDFHYIHKLLDDCHIADCSAFRRNYRDRQQQTKSNGNDLVHYPSSDPMTILKQQMTTLPISSNMLQTLTTALSHYNMETLLDDIEDILSKQSRIAKPLSNILKIFKKNDIDTNVFRQFHDMIHSAHNITIQDLNKLILFQQILDKIHCYYNHSYDQGQRLTKDEKDTIINTAAIDPTNCDDFILNQQIKMTNNIIKNKLKELHLKHGIKTMRNNKFTSQSFPINSEQNRDKLFSFGFIIIYDKGGYDTRTEHKNDDNYIGEVQSKYPSLKEELVHNAISCISINQYYSELEKAIVHQQSIYYKKRYDEVAFPLCNILSMLIYVNYDSLQSEFSKTYRKLNADESIESVKERHSHFWQLGKCMWESMSSIGETVMQCTVKKFYHGIGDKLVFPSTANRQFVYAPLSTSCEFTAAVNFTNSNNGIIVEFGDNVGFARQLSVQWLSDFPAESEHLFIGGDEGLRFRNITIAASGFEYRDVLEAFDTIYDVLHRKKPSDDIKSKVQCMSKRLIEHQLSLKNNIYRSCDSLRQYGKDLSARFFMNINSIHISCAIIAECYGFLTDLLLNERVNCIQLNIFLLLFPNLSQIIIENDIEEFDGNWISHISSDLKIIKEKECIKLKTIGINIKNNAIGDDTIQYWNSLGFNVSFYDETQTMNEVHHFISLDKF